MIINANQGSGGGGNLQPTVTVTPSTSTQPIKPDPPYNGLSEVIVNPAPLEAATVKSSTTQQPAITPTAPNIGFSSITVEPNLLQTKAVTLPTSQPIRPDSGYYGLAGVNVSAPLYQRGTVTPTASSQYINIPSSYYGLDALTVDAAPLDVLNVTPTSSSQSFTPTSPYIGYSSVTVGAASAYKVSNGYKSGSGSTEFVISTPDIHGCISYYIMASTLGQANNNYPCVYQVTWNNLNNYVIWTGYNNYGDDDNIDFINLGYISDDNYIVRVQGGDGIFNAGITYYYCCVYQ